MAVPAAPQNLLSRNVGNGSVELSWTASGGAVSYNIYLAIALAGTYTKINNAPILATTVRLPNFKFGITVYLKVTAVNADGESAQSAVSQDATCSQGIVTLQFEGLLGDMIPAGAMFTAKVGSRLVSFVTTTAGEGGIVPWVDVSDVSWVDACAVAWTA